ncbi:hypothetical protein ABZ137_28600 [Streptomyces bobili]|uniref:hypothetical protein n=1 Tax=Streptomyces bobili TaxID=67280 RepID=UPI0033B57F22
MVLWLAMSALCAWAACESFAFRVTGEQPALARSLLTRATTRVTAGVVAPAARALVAGDFGAAAVLEGGAAVGFGAEVVLVGAGGVVVFATGALGFSGAGAAVSEEVVGEAEGEAVAVGFAVRMSRPRYPSQDVFPPSVRCAFQDACLPSVQGPDVVMTASAPPSPMHAMAADGTATALIARTAMAMGRRRVLLRCFRWFLMRTSFGRVS